MGHKAANFLDLTNQIFNRLTVLNYAGSNGQQSLWNCLCECGQTTTVRSYSLTSGNTQSCGCLGKESRAASRRTHGMSDTAIYRVWHKMLERCTSPTNRDFKNYGERGITVCDRWLSFENFYADMGEKPVGKSLERKHNDLGYSPENCIWADRVTQNNNRRDNRLLTFNDKTQTLMQWVRETGLSRATVKNRLSAGWSVEKALSTPNLHTHYKPRHAAAKTEPAPAQSKLPVSVTDTAPIASIL